MSPAPVTFEDDHAAFKSALADMAAALDYAALAIAIGERAIVLDNAKTLDANVRSAHHGAAIAVRDAARKSIAAIAQGFEDHR